MKSSEGRVHAQSVQCYVLHGKDEEHFCQPSGRDRMDAMHGRGKGLVSRFQSLRREL